MCSRRHSNPSTKAKHVKYYSRHPKAKARKRTNHPGVKLPKSKSNVRENKGVYEIS